MSTVSVRDGVLASKSETKTEIWPSETETRPSETKTTPAETETLRIQDQDLDRDLIFNKHPVGVGRHFAI